MPLYVVRWPQLRASLMKARDIQELQSMIEEVCEPSLCEWWEYNGPLWIDFGPPVQFVEKHDNNKLPLQLHEFELEGLSEYADFIGEQDNSPLACTLGEGPGCLEMEEQLMSAAFPALGAFYKNWDGESAVHPHELDKVLRADLSRLMQLSWQEAADIKKRP